MTLGLAHSRCSGSFAGGLAYAVELAHPRSCSPLRRASATDRERWPGLQPAASATGCAAAYNGEDIRLTVDDLLAEGDKVIWRWTAEGTHQGPLMGIPASGKRVAFSGITIDRLVNGEIAERWSQMDTLGLLQQVGAIPVPG